MLTKCLVNSLLTQQKLPYIAQQTNHKNLDHVGFVQNAAKKNKSLTKEAKIKKLFRKKAYMLVLIGVPAKKNLGGNEVLHKFS